MPPPTQLNLFEHVGGAYAQVSGGRLSNEELYRMAMGRAMVDRTLLEVTSPVGKAGAQRSLVTRAIRWHQQSLKHLGLIQRVEDKRGVWELTAAGRAKLRTVRPGLAVLGFSTNLGVAIVGDCNHVFSRIDEPVCLALTSPPYPLAKPRAYGNPTLEDYVEFICTCLKPITGNLIAGGSIVLSLGDVFERGSPAKSTYIEELVLALKKQLGLSLMNRIIWASNKPPGPIQWASKQRMQLNEGHEYLLWFCNDPRACVADNRRVLEPHTDRHLQFVRNGGTKSHASHSDGAYQTKPGSYSAETLGRIPRTVWQVSNYCPSQREYKRNARRLGLAAHGAAMPLALARQVVRFMTQLGDLVVDPFGGSMTTGLAAELEQRRWVSTDTAFEYVRGAAERFREQPGFELALPR